MELILVGDDLDSGLNLFLHRQTVVMLQIVHDVLVVSIRDGGAGSHPTHIFHDVLPVSKNVLPDGTVVLTKDGFNWRTDGHILSGNMTMNQIMNRARFTCGLTKEQVGLLFAENPASCLRISDRGKIEIGRKSDFVLMDDNYDVKMTIINGEIFYQKEE